MAHLISFPYSLKLWYHMVPRARLWYYYGTLGRLCYSAVTDAAVCRLRHTPSDQISYEDVSVYVALPK